MPDPQRYRNYYQPRDDAQGYSQTTYSQTSSAHSQTSSPYSQTSSPYSQISSPYSQTSSPYSQTSSLYSQTSSPYYPQAPTAYQVSGNTTGYPPRTTQNYQQENTATYPQMIHPQSTTSYHIQEATAPRANSTAYIVLIMGQTGAGKSTFIRYATGSNVQVSDGLVSCTGKVELFQIPGSDVYLADSTGFGDTFRDEASILAELDRCLADIFHDQETKLAGVLFLHSLSVEKMSKHAVSILIMLKELVGSGNLKKCRIVTTKISRAPRHPDVIEKELRNDLKFFKHHVDQGAQMLRFKDSRDSAIQIIWSLVDGSDTMLKLTDETQNQHRDLEHTAAGRIVKEELLKASEESQEQQQDLRKKQAKSTARYDRELAAAYQERQDELREWDERLRSQRAILRTKAPPSSTGMMLRRWAARGCALAVAGCIAVASGGELTSIALAGYGAVEHSLQNNPIWGKKRGTN